MAVAGQGLAWAAPVDLTISQAIGKSSSHLYVFFPLFIFCTLQHEDRQRIWVGRVWGGYKYANSTQDEATKARDFDSSSNQKLGCDEFSSALPGGKTKVGRKKLVDVLLRELVLSRGE